MAPSHQLGQRTKRDVRAEKVDGTLGEDHVGAAGMEGDVNS
jgi:hypothetical protein